MRAIGARKGEMGNEPIFSAEPRLVGHAGPCLLTLVPHGNFGTVVGTSCIRMTLEVTGEAGRGLPFPSTC